MFLVALGTEIAVFLPAVIIKKTPLSENMVIGRSEIVLAALFVTCLFSSVILRAPFTLLTDFDIKA